MVGCAGDSTVVRSGTPPEAGLARTPNHPNTTATWE